LGVVILEAQATALPVVATWHGGIPEAVEHGVTGLLCAERDPGALAENILNLLSDGDLRTKMGLAARARVVEKFNLKNQSELLEQFYLEFL
jgi:glycosyltransferase involved in cell wall biosynthesis